jgi:hypothetical protein
LICRPAWQALLTSAKTLEQQTRPEEAPMGVLFEDDFLDGFGTWPLAYIPYGGPDFGELAAVGAKVGGGDADAFTNAWIEAGDRAVAAAEAAGKGGHKQSARELYLRASA